MFNSYTLSRVFENLDSKHFYDCYSLKGKTCIHRQFLFGVSLLKSKFYLCKINYATNTHSVQTIPPKVGTRVCETQILVREILHLHVLVIFFHIQNFCK